MIKYTIKPVRGKPKNQGVARMQTGRQFLPGTSA